MTGPMTVALALTESARRLAAAGVCEARREARLLLGHALGLGPEALIAYPERALAAAEAAGLEKVVERRCRREPMSHILERREFWSLSFKVSAQTLDPRPDSETVIEAALECVSDRAARLRVLDLGTGSGCLLLALLSELPNAEGLGVDISDDAVAIAASNAAALGLAGRARMERRDWRNGPSGRFDLILSNPPYIPSDAIDGLAPEVARFEPRLALDGGPDGLAAYRTLAPRIAELLSPGGTAIIEFGAGQASHVGEIFRRPGLEIAGFRHDLARQPRCIIVHRDS